MRLWLQLFDGCKLRDAAGGGAGGPGPKRMVPREIFILAMFLQLSDFVGSKSVFRYISDIEPRRPRPGRVWIRHDPLYFLFW